MISKPIIVKAQPINLDGNNSIFICRCISILFQEPESTLPKTFVAKEFGDDKDELGTYKQLACLQGIYIPRCYGEISWIDKEGVAHQGMALEFLKGFRSLQSGVDTKDRNIYKKCKEAIHAISSQGIYHGDIALRNLMWESVSKEIRVIDFEFSAAFTQAWVRDNEVIWENGITIATIPQQNLIDLESIFTEIKS